jgi:hypothetical protein
MRKILGLSSLALLSGCALFEPAAKPAPAAVAVCPPVVTYTMEFQAAAGAEMAMLNQLGLAPHVRQMIGDYGAERDRLRACKPPAP